MQRNFDIIAPFYDVLAKCVFGRAIQRSQLATLDFIPENATILIIGGGTGWFLKALLTRKKVKQIIYIDSSAKMLEYSRKAAFTSSLSQANSIDFRLGTEDVIRPQERFDVIITHFFLDLFATPHLHKIMHTLFHVLHRDSIWLCADFQLSTKASGWWWKNLLIKVNYLFFRVCCGIESTRLPDINSLFATYQMKCIYEVHSFHQLIFSKVYKCK